SRARNRSPDPVVSCFFGRIAPSDAATESCFSIRGNRENELQASKASDTETLQSQVNKAAKKRLSLSGLEILHGRLVMGSQHKRVYARLRRAMRGNDRGMTVAKPQCYSCWPCCAMQARYASIS